MDTRRSADSESRCRTLVHDGHHAHSAAGRLACDECRKDWFQVGAGGILCTQSHVGHSVMWSRTFRRVNMKRAWVLSLSLLAAGCGDEESPTPTSSTTGMSFFVTSAT